MVKTQHAIDTIYSRISSADVERVPLVRVAGNDERRSASMIDDPVTAAVQALAEPLEFPPLSAATVPGDRVAIAVDHDVPRAAAIVRGVVDALHGAGIDDDESRLSPPTSNSGGSAGRSWVTRPPRHPVGDSRSRRRKESLPGCGPQAP